MMAAMMRYRLSLCWVSFCVTLAVVVTLVFCR